MACRQLFYIERYASHQINWYIGILFIRILLLCMIIIKILTLFKVHGENSLDC